MLKNQEKKEMTECMNMIYAKSKNHIYHKK